MCILYAVTQVDSFRSHVRTYVRTWFHKLFSHKSSFPGCHYENVSLFAHLSHVLRPRVADGDSGVFLDKQQFHGCALQVDTVHTFEYHMARYFPRGKKIVEGLFDSKVVA